MRLVEKYARSDWHLARLAILEIYVLNNAAHLDCAYLHAEIRRVDPTLILKGTLKTGTLHDWMELLLRCMNAAMGRTQSALKTLRAIQNLRLTTMRSTKCRVRPQAQVM